ncbi:hypothetical protein OHC33_001677 [Knufia fluminis]|uniref:NAD(P)-binding domain-containing protein n=1 Tax=Knufia fluminis TaxID=191047 RepID=A0AAN8IBL8_9EURO|nr:hypothetical protein OHC33_001677 [Knufia fluminis]
MADTLSKVVLVGWDTTRLTRPPSCQQASGTIGTHILHALLEDPADNFEVTILTRPESTSTFPSHPSVTIARVAHDDYDGLTRTFSSHDAIIHAGAIPSIPTQPLLIKAAVAAGIKRFILNEFANSPITQTGLPETARFRQPRLDVLAVAKDAAANNPTFSWTGLAVGNILDLSLLRYPQFGIDVRKHSVKYTDDGTERVSAVILPDIGLAVRGILRAPEGTRNRYCHVRSVETDQVGIVRALEGRQGVRYAVSRESSEVLYTRGKEGFKRGKRSGFHDLVVVQLFGRVEGSGGSVIVGREESDNLLLGVREKEVGEVVEGVLRSLEEGDGNAGGSEGKDVLGQARRTMG